jgi:phenylalanyl-tRNA synthetase beta chain
VKYSMRWLRDYATLDAPLASIAKTLVDTGTEVGAVEVGGEGIVVARITAVLPVPGSSHLQFADIDLGTIPPSLAAFTATPGTVRVMTGAPNVKVGDLVPYAPPGSRPPAMEDRLGVKSIRGHKSPGMLCSAIELGVGENADGILILEDGTPGQAIGDVLSLDTVLELDITTNRPDCLCHLGIARELAAALGEGLTEPPMAVPDALLSATSAVLRARVRVDDDSQCPRFAARVIEGIVVAPSPAWLQQRLRSVGLRPINNVVDVTNFVTHELGQPMHAFDLDRFVDVGGVEKMADVVVRRAHVGEHVMDLLGTDRALSPEDVVVCAGETAASIAGVIGGMSTAVTDSTRTVLLEAATWDGPTVRATSKRLGLRTDASTLFEKGLSDLLPPVALERAASLIAEMSGGHVLRDVIDEWPHPLPKLGPIALTATFTGALLGIPIDSTEVATTLARLGFAVEQDGATLAVTPPYFRRDVALPEDLVEEVGRMLGYSRVPSTLPGRRADVTTTAPEAQMEDRIRDVCVGAGFDEAITLSFVGPAESAAIPGLGRGRIPMPLLNPLSDEWSVMRTSQLPRLCATVAANVNRGSADVMVFELGRAFWDGERIGLPEGSTPDDGDRGLPPLPLEPLLLSLAAHVSSGDPVDAVSALLRVQSVFDWVVADLSGRAVRAEPSEEPGLHPGRSARLTLDGNAVGVLGELSFETAATFEIRGRVAVGELQIDAVAPSRQRPVRFVAPPRFPAIVQDLAVTVAADRLAGDAIDAIHEAQQPLLESVELYDEYRGGNLAPGTKSWTFRLTYRAPDRTLTGEEAQLAQQAIAAALAQRCGAEIRR